jgi:hypothetical protein
MSDAAIVASFQALLQDFAPCFTSPSFASFELLMILDSAEFGTAY